MKYKILVIFSITLLLIGLMVTRAKADTENEQHKKVITPSGSPNSSPISSVSPTPKSSPDISEDEEDESMENNDEDEIDEVENDNDEDDTTSPAPIVNPSTTPLPSPSESPQASILPSPSASGEESLTNPSPLTNDDVSINIFQQAWINQILELLRKLLNKGQ